LQYLFCGALNNQSKVEKMRSSIDTYVWGLVGSNEPGKGVTSDPVAIMMFFVFTTSTTLPSGPMTDTSLVPVIFP
jgi:hypothetical protein